MNRNCNTVGKLEVFGSIPALDDHRWKNYLESVDQVTAWSEAAGMTGALIYTDNAQPDPWAVTQYIISRTRQLSPLVAVQPLWMHPVAAAKMIASLAYLYRRRIWLNLVAGGFKDELEAVGDHTPHDQRYARLLEYTLVIKELLGSSEACSFKGQYYSVEGVVGTPALSRELLPGVLMSGSSVAGLSAARATGATSIVYPLPVAQFQAPDAPQGWGIRVGIIARDTSVEAWNLAAERFPKFREGEIRHRIIMLSTDSDWRKQMDNLPAPSLYNGVYWLEPFKSYRGNCPYLIGSHDEVAAELARYLRQGCGTVILSEPFEEQDYIEAASVLERASVLAGTAEPAAAKHRGTSNSATDSGLERTTR
jgi:alkanesulfonate monooxygenase